MRLIEINIGCPLWFKEDIRITFVEKSLAVTEFISKAPLRVFVNVLKWLLTGEVFWKPAGQGASGEMLGSMLFEFRNHRYRLVRTYSFNDSTSTFHLTAQQSDADGSLPLDLLDDDLKREIIQALDRAGETGFTDEAYCSEAAYYPLLEWCGLRPENLIRTEEEAFNNPDRLNTRTICQAASAYFSEQLNARKEKLLRLKNERDILLASVQFWKLKIMTDEESQFTATVPAKSGDYVEKEIENLTEQTLILMKDASDKPEWKTRLTGLYEALIHWLLLYREEERLNAGIDASEAPVPDISEELMLTGELLAMDKKRARYEELQSGIRELELLIIKSEMELKAELQSLQAVYAVKRNAAAALSEHEKESEILTRELNRLVKIKEQMKQTLEEGIKRKYELEYEERILAGLEQNRNRSASPHEAATEASAVKELHTEHLLATARQKVSELQAVIANLRDKYTQFEKEIKTLPVVTRNLHFAEFSIQQARVAEKETAEIRDKTEKIKFALTHRTFAKKELQAIDQLQKELQTLNYHPVHQGSLSERLQSVLTRLTAHHPEEYQTRRRLEIRKQIQDVENHILSHLDAVRQFAKKESESVFFSALTPKEGTDQVNVFELKARHPVIAEFKKTLYPYYINAVVQKIRDQEKRAEKIQERIYTEKLESEKLMRYGELLQGMLPILPDGSQNAFPAVPSLFHLLLMEGLLQQVEEEIQRMIRTDAGDAYHFSIQRAYDAKHQLVFIQENLVPRGESQRLSPDARDGRWLLYFLLKTAICEAERKIFGMNIPLLVIRWPEDKLSAEAERTVKSIIERNAHNCQAIIVLTRNKTLSFDDEIRYYPDVSKN